MCSENRGIIYGCDNWTYSKAIDHKINAFEMWCYRRMLRISWTSHTTNIDVLQKIGVKETTMFQTMFSPCQTSLVSKRKVEPIYVYMY